LEVARISVVIPTRNRPDQIGQCVEGVLANAHDSFEVVVADQSDGADSEAALAPYLHDSRLRYVRTATRGAGAARNVGIVASKGELVLFTDDDCRVPKDWISGMVHIFDTDPDVGVVFGRVDVPANAFDGGFLAAFLPVKREYRRCFPQGLEPWGISANMGARRKVLDEVGTFDALLGPGTKFIAGEDVDFAIRVLGTDWKVVNAEEVPLLHLGVRSGDGARRLLLGYMFATGTVFTKHVRLGTPGGWKLLADFTSLHLNNIASSLRHGRRPTGIRQLASLLNGIVRSLPQPIDRERKVYSVKA